MASGQRPFHGESQSALIAAILGREPLPLPSIRSRIPGSFDRLIRTCLAKDPDERWQSAADLRHALQWIGTEPLSAQPIQRRFVNSWPIWLAATCIVATAAVLVTIRVRHAPELPVLRGISYSGEDWQPSASPDGKAIAFTSLRGGGSRIWLKELTRGDEFPLTEGPHDDFPRFSPDGTTILFRRDEALYRIATLGGSQRKLVDGIAGDGDWSPDGAHIAFVRKENAGWVVYTAGANGESARAIARERQPVHSLRWSPDGGMIVAQVSGIVSVVTPMNMLVVTPDGSNRRIVSSAQGGFLISTPAWAGKDEILYAQALTITGGTALPSGSARLVKQNLRSGDWTVVTQVPQAASTLDVVASGTVVMDAVSSRQNLVERPLSDKVDRDPARPVMPGTAQDRQPVYSPDGEWILFSSNRSGNLDLWKLSVKNGELRRLTDDPAHDWDPAFTPDGKQIVWSSSRSGMLEIWTADADGVGPRQVSHDGFGAENPEVTADGWVYYVSGNPAKRGVWKIRMDGSNATRIVEGSCLFPDLSPDGRYIAFRRDLKTQIVSLADGKPASPGIDNISRTRWTADGHSLIFSIVIRPGPYNRGTRGLWLQDFAPGLDTSATRRPISSVDPSLDVETWAASPDGKRIVISAREFSRGLVLARNVPGVVRPEKK